MNFPRRLFLFITLWLCFSSCIADPARANGKLWNLQDADIISVINEVSQETGKNFIIDPHVQGKISLISSKPINPAHLYHVFLSILDTLGYTAIPSGNVTKIIPSTDSSEMATRLASQQAPGKGDEIVVRVIPLDHISAAQLIPSLRPLLPQWSHVSAYTPGNVLILVGQAANLQRIAGIIYRVDKAADNEVDIVPLRQASATQIATIINNLQNASKAAGETTSIFVTPDERSNSLLLSGNRAARLRTRHLVAQLDAPTTGLKDNTQVIYLRYLQAKNLAPILNKIAQNLQKKELTLKKTASPETDEINSPNIQAEPNTNALIVTAPPGLMHSLNAIIRKLDVRPAQVLVEAIIVEINQDDLKSLGIHWGSVTSNGTVDSSAFNGSPFDFPPLGPGIVGIMPSEQIKAILSILEHKRGVDILSTPSLVVLDNQKAALQVGKDIPEQTGSYATTGGTNTVTPFNTIARKQVTLSLKVTPQINLGAAVRLNIELSNDTLQDPESPGLNPIINTSKIMNSVILNSGDILVLGGLISNNITENTSKVPILGDVPIIGTLFQSKTRKLEKKNLVTFIKPVILQDELDSQTLTLSKYDAAREAQINWPVELTEEGEQKRQNILPLWKNNTQLPVPFEKS